MEQAETSSGEDSSRYGTFEAAPEKASPEVSWGDQAPPSDAAIQHGIDSATPREASAGEDRRPLMADLMCGGNAPLTKDFLMAQSVDRLFGEEYDLSSAEVQSELHNLLEGADFI